MRNESGHGVMARSLNEFRRLNFREFIYSIMHTFEDFDYSLPQVASLLLLDEEGEKTIKQVAEWLGRSVSTTSRLLDHLVVRGMITRREDERDRRMKRVAITAQGRVLMPQILRESAAIKGDVAVYGNLTYLEVRSMEVSKQLAEEQFTAEDEKTLDELGI